MPAGLIHRVRIWESESGSPNRGFRIGESDSGSATRYNTSRSRPDFPARRRPFPLPLSLSPADPEPSAPKKKAPVEESMGGGGVDMSK